MAWAAYRKSFVLPLRRFLPHGKLSQCHLLFRFVRNSKPAAILIQFPKDHLPFAVFLLGDVALPLDVLWVRHLHGIAGMPGGLVIFIEQPAALGDRSKVFLGRSYGLLCCPC
ncbi:MAG TPA: hypothetical protein VGR55_20015 [Candidatus Acidoferrum sp.]|nr:hypothetical protein [Candidatus Acidoferrum sp.]